MGDILSKDEKKIKAQYNKLQKTFQYVWDELIGDFDVSNSIELRESIVKMQEYKRSKEKEKTVKLFTHPATCKIPFNVYNDVKDIKTAESVLEICIDGVIEDKDLISLITDYYSYTKNREETIEYIKKLKGSKRLSINELCIDVSKELIKCVINGDISLSEYENKIKFAMSVPLYFEKFEDRKFIVNHLCMSEISIYKSLYLYINKINKVNKTIANKEIIDYDTALKKSYSELNNEPLLHLELEKQGFLIDKNEYTEIEIKYLENEKEEQEKVAVQKEKEKKKAEEKELEMLLESISYDEAHEVYMSVVRKNGRGLRVKLTVDLTRYNPNLVVGATGKLGGTRMYDDRARYINFDNFEYGDVIYSGGYEIIDEVYLNAKKILKYYKQKCIDTAENVELYQGKLGAFKRIEYTYTDVKGDKQTNSIYDIEKEEYLALFEKFNIPITVKTV